MSPGKVLETGQSKAGVSSAKGNEVNACTTCLSATFSCVAISGLTFGSREINGLVPCQAASGHSTISPEARQRRGSVPPLTKEQTGILAHVSRKGLQEGQPIPSYCV